jgi:hypothetical protein
MSTISGSRPVRWVIWTTIGALVISNAAWAVAYLDRAITLDHRSDELRRQRAISELLSALVAEPPQGTSAREVHQTLLRRYPGRIVKLSGDTVEIDGVILEFRDGKVARVSTM